MATQFERALEEEQEHLARVKRWVRGAGQADAHFRLGAAGEQPSPRG
jgi:hypothetical protein